MALASHPLVLSEPIEISAIPRALRAAREALAKQNGDAQGLRVCTLNLAAYCNDPAFHEEAMTVLQQVVAMQPGRLFLVEGREEDGVPLLQARIAVDGHTSPNVPPTYSELIVLEGQGADRAHLPATLVSLFEPDQPVAVWYCTPPGFHGFWRRATQAADRIVVDTRGLDPWDLMRLVEYVKSDSIEHAHDDQAALGDLNWARLRPFQALVARFFDDPQVSARIRDLDRVVITHTKPPDGAAPVGAAMLGAWISQRLKAAARKQRVKLSPRVRLLPVGRRDLEPGEVSGLAIHGEGEARIPIELAVVRPNGQPTTWVGEARQGVDSFPSQLLRANTQEKARLLTQEIAIAGRDLVFEESLIAAVEILRESRR